MARADRLVGLTDWLWQADGTDAVVATLIQSNIDPRDHASIVGATNPFVESLIEATHSGASSDWEQRAGAMTFVEAVSKTLSGGALARWSTKCWGKSLTELQAFSRSLGLELQTCTLTGRKVEPLKVSIDSRVEPSAVQKEQKHLLRSVMLAGWRLARLESNSPEHLQGMFWPHVQISC